MPEHDIRKAITMNANIAARIFRNVDHMDIRANMIQNQSLGIILCFGWIDGINKKISDTELAQRLSPRNKTSNWTELNKERVRRLNKLGLMKKEGLKILPDMRPESFTIDIDIELV